MSAPLVTRCPTCATSFRVAPAQLSARGGRVRCGKCSGVFDGLANLVEDAPAVVEPEPSPQISLFDPRNRVSADPANDSAAAAGTDEVGAVQDPAAIEPAPADAAADASAQEYDAEPLPEFLEERPRQRPYRLLWGFLSLLALVGLAAQFTYHYRTEIAALFPQTRPHLEVACEVLDCQLRLPRRAEMLSIESSDLQADARRANVLVLNAVVRNRAPFPQEYPSLELTLTNERDELVVRRVLTPADYLAERSGVARGIAAGGEEALRLYLETAKVRATGYRLYLFFP